MTEDPNLYVTQLTSLRGIACLVVLVGHVIQVFRYHLGASRPMHGWLRSALTYPFNAEAAVLLFFVLSGCVLSLSLRRLSGPDERVILGFWVKRVFRIYPLLCASVPLAAVATIVARPFASPDVLVGWLARNLSTPVTVGHVAASLSGFFTRFNGPMWSLRVEIIWSALFPAVFLLVRHERSRYPALAVLLLLALLPLPTPLGTAFGFSFALGAMLPRLALPDRGAVRLLAPAAIAFLLYDRWALAPLHLPERVFDVAESVASALLIRDVYSNGSRYRLLRWRPVFSLGEVSYGVYLLHLPILLLIFAAGARLFGVGAMLDATVLTPVVLAALTAVATVALAALSFNLLELPLHQLGRRLGDHIARGGAPAADRGAFPAPGRS